MLDVTKIRHRSPINPNTIKRSYVLNYADCDTAFDVLGGDVCLWGKLQFFLYRYEVYGEMPKVDMNNSDDLKVYTLFSMFAPKLDANAEEWKHKCEDMQNVRKGKGKNP